MTKVQVRNVDAATVRVWGIDAPEPCGPAATDVAQQLVGGEVAGIEIVDQDQHAVASSARRKPVVPTWRQASPSPATPGTAGSTIPAIQSKRPDARPPNAGIEKGRSDEGHVLQEQFPRVWLEIVRGQR